ncbi:unnamed protein product, partial [Prorocentrum cordatum]
VSATGFEPRAGPALKANRWSNVPAGGPPPARPWATPGAPPAPSHKALVREMKAGHAAVAPGQSAQFCQQWFDERFKESSLEKADLQVSREVCKNCLFSGKGVVEHTFKQCRDLKNKCVLPCPRCVAAGRLTGDVCHCWSQDCKCS